MEPNHVVAATGVIGVVALLVLKREFNRIMEAVDRIPSTKTFTEWNAKLEALDTGRLNSHYKMVHDLNNVVGTHELLIQQHGKRIERLETYSGPERRQHQRERNE